VFRLINQGQDRGHGSKASPNPNPNPNPNWRTWEQGVLQVQGEPESYFGIPENLRSPVLWESAVASLEVRVRVRVLWESAVAPLEANGFLFLVTLSSLF